MKRAIKLSLGFKFSVVIMLMSLLIGTFIVLASLQIYTQQISDRYSEQGEALANSAAAFINWDKLDEYAESLTVDEEYRKTLEKLRLCANTGTAAHLFVAKPQDGGFLYIYDTGSDDEQLPLGHYAKWHQALEDHAEELLQGKQIEPVTTNDQSDWLMGIYIPFSDSQGEFAGYVGVGYSGEHLRDEEWTFIGELIVITLIIATLMTTVFLLLLRFLVLKPVSKIADATDSYLDIRTEDVKENNSIATMRIKTRDELQSLSESLMGMEKKIRDHAKHLEQATFKAETDSMTDLLNREAFEWRVEKALAEKDFDGYYVFMMIDLDRFKNINDSFGHAVGDAVIVKCGQVIQSKFRQSDFVARIGGDEYAVFYKSPASLDEIEKRANALCEAVRNTEFIDDLKVTLSVGVFACEARIAPSYQYLYVHADDVLYDVKEQGRNGYLVRKGQA